MNFIKIPIKNLVQRRIKKMFNNYSNQQITESSEKMEKVTPFHSFPEIVCQTQTLVTFESRLVWITAGFFSYFTKEDNGKVIKK